MKYVGTDDMRGWDHFQHETVFPEKPVPAGMHVCVFLINIHTASDQLTSSDHFLCGLQGFDSNFLAA